MTLLPIVERELRVASRRRGTYWTRAAIVLVATIVAIVTFLASLVIPVAKFGQLLFWGLSGMSMAYCLVAGRQLTADSLSEEKREGTFGLLFLTDLKGYDVVLGKLAARSFNGFYGLVAIVPILAIPLLVGGMTYGEFWRMVLVLVDTFAFTLSVGMFVSAISRDYQRVMGRNFAVLLLTTALLPACAAVLLILQPTRPVPPELLFPCPIYTFLVCNDSDYTKTPARFWSSAAVIHCMTWGFIFLACRLAPRSWQDQPLPSRSDKVQKRHRWRWWIEGDEDKRNAFRKQLLDQNAYYWLAARPYVKRAWVWTLLALVVCWMARTALAVGQLEETVFITGALLLNSTLKLWIAMEAGQQLAADQKGGAFELLLSTPLTVDDILRGQLLALARQFLKPLLVVMGAEFIFMLVLARPGAHPGVSSVQVALVWTAGIVMLGADATALSVVAMASALIAKGYSQASMRTVRYILVLPWALYGIVFLIADLFLPWWPDSDSYRSWKYGLALWFGLGISIDVLFGWTAWHRLRADFRELALRSHHPPRSRFFDLWRRRIRAAIAAIWTPSDRPGQRTPRGKLKRALVLGAAVVICVGLYLSHRNPASQTPKPVIVSLGPTNTALRIIQARDGLLFVLPDGSLWRWGIMNGEVSPRAAVPEPVGANSNWVDAFSGWSYTIGLRADGTVWEWRERPGPRQVDPGRDWAQISGGYYFAVILKRDGTLWTWGTTTGQFGTGSGPAGTNLVQIGTNSNWKAIGRQGTSMVALQQNGTLWMWGNIGTFVSGASSSPNAIPPVNRNYYRAPVQVCRETNWVSLTPGFPAVARNQAGELWNVHYLLGPPSSTAPAFSVLYRIGTISNAADPAFGLLRDGSTSPTGTRYEVRSNGTLWATPVAWWPYANPVAQEWKQFGARHDWISVWGDINTLVGLTSDGTVWTWGTDWSQEPAPVRQSILETLTLRMGQMFGGSRTGFVPSKAQPVRTEPRPLMRLTAGAASQTNRVGR